MKKRILAVVSNNLATDQRLIKIGTTLQNHGFDFKLVGTQHRGTPSLEHIPFETHRIRIKFQSNFPFYTELQFKIFKELWKQKTKDTILLANDLDTLLPTYWVSKISGLPLVFDSHEIFSEMPTLKEGSIQKRVWKGLEKFLVPKVKNIYTVSDSYAQFFKSKYGVNPTVIKNVPFQKVQTNQLNSNNSRKILLYQGAINYSRGLDDIILAMEFLDQAELWIVGSGPLLDDFKKLVKEKNLEDNVIFFGQVFPSELQQITPKADLGISLEQDKGLSYKYALPNKIFDYIQAKVPILGSSDLPEVVKIVNEYKLGEIVYDRNPKALANKINEILALGKKAYLPGLEAAAKEFIWEKQEYKLVQIFEEIANG